MSAVLKHIAAITKGLNKAELHVLIELASRAESTGGREAVASSRELAEQTGLARSSIQLALDSLHEKGLLYSETGNTTRSARHRLLFLEPVESQADGPKIRPGVARESDPGGLKIGPGVAQTPGQGGPTVGPEVARESGQGGPKIEPVVARKPGQGGLNSRPPLLEKSNTCEPAHKEIASVRAESIEKNDFDLLIDGLHKAKKGDFDNAVFEEARNLIASHHAKFAREGLQIAGLPDDQITSQFLAIADWPRLNGMLWDLMSERKPSGHSWGWYITVALQRIHGISPDRVRDMRMKLRSTVARTPKNISPTCPPSSSTAQITNRCGAARAANLDLSSEIRTIAANKAMR